MADVITVVNIVPNLSSGESNGDSEANLAVNSASVQEMVATAFTPSPNLGSQKSPVFFSSDGGLTWALKDLINATPVRDQTNSFRDGRRRAVRRRAVGHRQQHRQHQL